MSVNESTITSIVVAIDTDQYSGNFERQMCAYITGRVGECGVGEELVAEAEEALTEEVRDWLCEHVIDEPDDNGCHRPTSIWPTPNRANDGFGNHRDATPEEEAKGYSAYESVAIFFDVVPPPEIMDIIRARAATFGAERPDKRFGKQKPLAIKRIRVLEPKLLKPRKVEHVEVARYPA